MLVTSKPTQHNVLDNTKNSNNNYPKSLFSISDVNKLYRREQTYKKKLKAVVQTNCLLEARIKIYQSTIKDQRSTIVFQLNQLSKTMNNKISTYVDEKLDKEKFKDNQQALQTIKQMICKFESVQKQTKVTKRVYQNLNSIYERYVQYSSEIDTLVKMTQKSNKQYEDGMKNMLHQKQSQIVCKRQKNEDIFDQTQTATKKIDQYETQKLKLVDQQKELQKYIQKLKKIEEQTVDQVNRFKQWAQIVIDKNHRKMFNKQNKQKQEKLNRKKQINKKLEVYLKELQNQEQVVIKKLTQKQSELQVCLQRKAHQRSKSNNSKAKLNNSTINTYERNKILKKTAFIP